jgi:enoyl-CoA hydratase/carnithine racemase
MRRLRSAIEKIQTDTTAKVVLVASSVPGAFCAGADLKVWTVQLGLMGLASWTQLNEHEFRFQ